MKSYDALQLIIVFAAVLLSGLYMLGRIVPTWRSNLSKHLQQSRYPHWVNAIGVAIAGAAGCGSGCNSCDSCPSNSAKNKSS